jgi:hypothetical protein
MMSFRCPYLQVNVTLTPYKPHLDLNYVSIRIISLIWAMHQYATIVTLGPGRYCYREGGFDWSG